MLFQDGDEHGEAIAVEAAALAFGGAEEACGGQGLDFDEEAACAGDDGAEDAALARRVLIGECADDATFYDFAQAAAAHVEEADFEGAAVAVFD